MSELIKTVEALKEEIRLLRNGKNSGTSHTPPSHQIGRSNAQSLRIKTDRNRAVSRVMKVRHYR